MECHEERCQERKKRLPRPCDNCKEHEQNRKREHQEFCRENPAEVVAEERHAKEVKERKSLCLETVRRRFAGEAAVFEYTLVAGGGFVVVVHVLGDGHKDAFIALDAVASFDLHAGKDGYYSRKDDYHDANRLFGEDSFDPFPKIFV